MIHKFQHVLVLIAAAGLFSAVAKADQLALGYVSWDVTSDTTGEFDIINQTGPNSSGDATFPVTTTVDLESLSLTVDFSNSTSEVFGSSYFSLSSDGISFDGGTIVTGGANPVPLDATLTGTFSPTSVTLFDGSTDTISSDFTATIESSSGVGSPLNDADLAIIYATTSGGSPVPEPSSLFLVMTCAGALLLFRKRLSAKLKSSPKAFMPLAVVLSLVVLSASQSWAAVKLNVSTAPSFGGAGQTQVNVTGSGFPAGVTAPERHRDHSNVLWRHSGCYDHCNDRDAGPRLFRPHPFLASRLPLNRDLLRICSVPRRDVARLYEFQLFASSGFTYYGGYLLRAREFARCERAAHRSGTRNSIRSKGRLVYRRHRVDGERN